MDKWAGTKGYNEGPTRMPGGSHSKAGRMAGQFQVEPVSYLFVKLRQLLCPVKDEKGYVSRGFLRHGHVDRCRSKWAYHSGTLALNTPTYVKTSAALLR